MARRRDSPIPVFDDSYTLWTLFGGPGARLVLGTPGLPQRAPREPHPAGTSRGHPREPPGIPRDRRDPPEASQNSPRILPACRIFTVSSQIRFSILSESSQNHGNPIRKPKNLPKSCQNPSSSLRNASRIVPISRILPDSPRSLPESLQKPSRILLGSFQYPQNPS